MKARVPHGLLTSVELNPLPVLRGLPAAALFCALLEQERKHYYYGGKYRDALPQQGKAFWMTKRTPHGNQWAVLQPDEWLPIMKAWSDGPMDLSGERTAAAACSVYAGKRS